MTTPKSMHENLVGNFSLCSPSLLVNILKRISNYLTIMQLTLEDGHLNNFKASLNEPY